MHYYKSLQKHIHTFLLFLICTSILIIPIKSAFNIYDEGFALTTAYRIGEGDTPNLDMWSPYPSTQFYILNVLFSYFNPSIFTARVYDAFVKLVLLVSIFFVVRNILPKRYTYFVLVAVSLLIAYSKLYLYLVFPAVAFGILGIYFYHQFCVQNGKKFLLYSGFFVGLSTLFRWDFGCYFIFTITITQLAVSIKESLKSGLGLQTITILSHIKPIAVYFWSALLMASLPVYIFWTIQSGLYHVFDQLVIFPLTILKSTRTLPVPSLIPIDIKVFDWFFFYTPITIVTIFIVRTIKNFFFNKQLIPQTFSLLVITSCFLLHAVSRYDIVHSIPFMIGSLIVTCILLSQKKIRKITKIGVYAYLIIFSFFYFRPQVRYLKDCINSISPFSSHSMILRAGGVKLNENQEKAIKFIQKNTQKNEKIYVGNTHHDFVFINDISLYFLAERLPVTAYHCLHPGVATTVEVQNEIISGIQKHNTPYLVLVDFQKSIEPNNSSISSGVFKLDTFIEKNYRKFKSFGTYQVWKRKLL